MPTRTKKISSQEQSTLFRILQTRFEKHMDRHTTLQWQKVQKRLEASPEKLWSLQAMEQTGGEPDVIEYDKKTGNYIFYDCSPETPAGRRSLCYDATALRSRKKHPPKHSATGMATEIGITLLTEDQYRTLQKYGQFDTKTSSWIDTPKKIRELGGALFADFRYNTVFVYHNGAESYYAARGFRGMLQI